MQLDHAAVRDRMMRAVAHLAAKSPHRAAMGDDQDAAPEVRAGDALDRCVHPFPVLIARLAVRPVAVREPRLELGAGEAGPGADVDLAQPSVADHGHAMGRRDDHRRLVGPCEVARVDSIEGGRAQLLRELARLGAPVLVQRRVGPALPAALAVPVGLTVARKKERGHVA